MQLILLRLSSDAPGGRKAAALSGPASPTSSRSRPPSRPARRRRATRSRPFRSEPEAWPYMALAAPSAPFPGPGRAMGIACAALRGLNRPGTGHTGLLPNRRISVRQSHVPAIARRCFVDPVTQLFGSFFGLLLAVAALVWICTPLLWTWLLIRFFRDMHSVKESVHWIAHCTRAPELPVQTPRRPLPEPTGAISTSAFGR